MARRTEVAKFFCGFEAFHALFHAYFWLSATTFTAFGIRATPRISFASFIVNAAISLALGVWAWRPSEQRSA